MHSLAQFPVADVLTATALAEISECFNRFLYCLCGSPVLIIDIILDVTDVKLCNYWGGGGVLVI